MKYRLTQQAKQDLRQIRDTISADNPAAAGTVIDAILETLSFLCRYPRVGALRQDLGEGLRAFPAQRPAQRYVVFFQADEKLLIVKRVLHGARDFPAVFK